MANFEHRSTDSHEKQLDRTAMSDQKVVSDKLQYKFELFDKPKSDNKVNEGQ